MDALTRTWLSLIALTFGTAALAMFDGRLAAAGIDEPERVRYLAVDFEQQDLRTALAAGGVDLGQPYLASWLGVVVYLAAATVAATVRMIGQTPGAEVVLEGPHHHADDERHRHRRPDGGDRRAGVVDEEPDRQRDDEGDEAGSQRRRALGRLLEAA